MVKTTDAGHKLLCPKCGGVIEDGENVGAVDDGRNFWHSDCWRDEFGKESAMDERQREDYRTEISEKTGLHKEQLNIEESLGRWRRAERWAEFEKRGKNPYGGRYIA